MPVQEIKVPVSIIKTVDGSVVKYVVIQTTINDVTRKLVAKYSDNLYYVIKSKVINEYYKPTSGEVSA